MRKKLIMFIIVLFFLLAIASIGLGLYFNFISKPSNIFGMGIDVISDNFKEYFYSTDFINIGDNFDIESKIDFDLDSEYYLRMSKSNNDDLKTYNLIKNLSNLDTNISIKQNKKDKTAYLELNQKLNNEEINDSKIYVTNATKYYFVKGILKNYVNDGTCNYFETLTEDTTKDNIDYLYDFIIDSLKDNLKDSYFKEYDVQTNISGESQDVHQISLEINDKLIHNILNGILDDLKNDKRANNILSNTDTSFSNYKLNDETTFLESNQKYTINLYTTKFLYKPLKYEVIYVNEDIKKNYIYEENGDNFDFYYIENDSVKYKGTVSFNNKGMNAKIVDSSDKDVGKIKLEKDINNINFDFNFDNSEEKIDIVYYSKKEKNTDDIVYLRKIDFKHIVNKESRISGNVTLESKVNKKVLIDEDITDAILSSKLKDEEKKQFDEKIKRVRERLEK